MGFKYLTQEHLNGFDKYKYSCVDTSPLAVYIMHPFWNAVVKLYPMWIAPNLLTFIGFLFQFALFLLLALYDWDFYANNRTKPEYPSIPNWVWLMAAACQFLGHTLDGTDGKQARRTGSSTPLGELFDHGSDSVIAVFLPISLYSIFGRGLEDLGGSTWIFLIVLWLIIVTFFFSHLEKYITGLLFLPWSYDFSQLTIAAVYLLTGLFGCEVWKGPGLFGVLPYNYFFLGVVSAGAVFFSIPVSLYNISRSYADGTGKNRSFAEAMRPLYPMLLLVAGGTLWAYYSPNNILENYLRIFLMQMSIVFSNITVRLIISQMSDTRAAGSNSILTLTMVAALISCVVQQYEVLLLHALFTISLLLHLHYAVSIVNELCNHFNIYAFSITSRPKSKNHVK